MRVQQKNPEEEVVYIKGFCKPSVDPARWDAVHATRKRRSDAIKAARAAKHEVADEKQLPAVAAGVCLKYLLTGLVYCAGCGSRMAPCSSCGAVKNGPRYAYYRCPMNASGACDNRRYVREDKLRTAVLARVRALLFPPPTVGAGANSAPAWLSDLMNAVRQELAAMTAATPDRGEALQVEIKDLRARMSGWMQSLSKHDLSAMLRQELEQRYDEAAARVLTIEQDLAVLDCDQQNADAVFDPSLAIDALRRLEQVLAGGNVSDGNFELSLHIDAIEAFSDGTVIMRTSMLGAFEGAVELLSRQGTSPAGGDKEPVTGGQYRVTNRRRSRLRLSDPNRTTANNGGDEARVAARDRFAGLDAKWFWEEFLPLERKVSWAQKHAQEVTQLRRQDPERWSLAKLARHFSVSRPTIANALKKGAAAAVPSEPSQDAPADAA